MSQLEAYKVFVVNNTNQLWLMTILNSRFAAEYRKLHTLMRREGWEVSVEINRKRPSLNIYRFKAPKMEEALKSL